MRIILFLLLTCSLAFEKRAYVTVVTDEESLHGVMVMGASLLARTRKKDDSEYSVDYTCLVLFQKTTGTKRGIGKLGLKNWNMLDGKSIKCNIPSQIQTVIQLIG